MLDQLTADPRGLRFWFDRNLAADRRALLVVDQFEELFTLCRDPFEREAFVDNLLEASQAGGLRHGPGRAARRLLPALRTVRRFAPGRG